MEYVKAGRLLGRQAKAYFADVLPLARDWAEATFSASYLFARLCLVLLRPLFSLTLYLWRALSPAARVILQRLWAAFCLQPARVLAIEAGAAVLALLLTMVERRFGLLRRAHAFTIGTYQASVRRYRGLLQSLRTKSRLAALALPHLLFAGLATAVHISVGKHIAAFTQGAGMVLLACVRPAVKTVLLLYSVEVDDELAVASLTPAVDASAGVQSPLAVRAASAPTAAPSDGDRPSIIRRRKRASISKDSPVDPVRTRAANVAAEIENDGDEANVPRQSRVRINETPLRRRESRQEAVPEKDASELRTPEALPNRGRRRTAFTGEDESAVRESMEVTVLRFWVVFGLVWAMRSVTWYFCPAVLEHAMGQLDTLLFYFFLWAQLGMTSGASVAYSAISAIARRRWKLDGRQRRESGRLQQVNVFMRLAVAAHLVDAERAADVASIIAESGFALLGIVFLITPRVATFLGTLLIGLLVPCYLSTSTLEAPGASGLTRHNWLSYWAVYSLTDAGFAAFSEMFGWVPLWYHVKMIIILWLQLPYYRGSVVVLDFVMGYVGSALSSVRKQVVTPRKRKRT